MPIDPLHAEVTRIALVAAGHEFALAGGNALIAHGMLSRPTADVDLFSPIPGGAAQVADAVREALSTAGFTVESVAGGAEGNDDFRRFLVSRDGRSVLLDLARDWRAQPPVVMPVGPVLALDDAVASKAAALAGRGLPRDYIDIAAALTQFDRRQLLQLAFDCDPGLRVEDFTHAAQRLDELADEQFTLYGLTPQEVAQLRSTFESWPRSTDTDEEGRKAHTAAHAKRTTQTTSAAVDTQHREAFDRRRTPPEHPDRGRDAGLGR